MGSSYFLEFSWLNELALDFIWDRSLFKLRNISKRVDTGGTIIIIVVKKLNSFWVLLIFNWRDIWLIYHLVGGNFVLSWFCGWDLRDCHDSNGSLGNLLVIVNIFQIIENNWVFVDIYVVTIYFYTACFYCILTNYIARNNDWRLRWIVSTACLMSHNDIAWISFSVRFLSRRCPFQISNCRARIGISLVSLFWALFYRS